jgi:ketosteroid isomerase-like protein
VQIVRRLMAAFNSRDVAGVLEVMDPAVEFFAPQTALSVERTVPYHGHEGIRQYFDDIGGVWDRLQVTPHEFRSNKTHVVALGTIVGQREGQNVDTKVAWAWKLRGGRVVWGRVYENPEEALEDANIKEETA